MSLRGSRARDQEERNHVVQRLEDLERDNSYLLHIWYLYIAIIPLAFRM
jgi:hypothetical protein